MTRDEIVRLLERRQAVWDVRDPEGIAAMYSEDCKVSSPIFGEIRGRAAVAQANVRLFEAFPDWNLVLGELIIDGSRAAQLFKVTATHVGEFMGLPGTGRKAQFQGVRIMTIKDNLIAEEMRLYDFTLLLMQIGVLRGKPGH